MTQAPVASSAHPERRGGEDALTLVELLVVVVLVAVVGSIVTSGIVSALRSAQATNARVEALNELEIATQRISRDLRAAEAIIVDADEPGWLITSVLREEDGSLSQVTYFVDSDDVLRRFDTQQTLVTAIGNDRAETAGDPEDPIFTYHRQDGSIIETCDGPTTCDGLAQVGVRLVRDIDDRTPVVVETRTAIRNVRYGTIRIIAEDEID